MQKTNTKELSPDLIERAVLNCQYLGLKIKTTEPSGEVIEQLMFLRSEDDLHYLLDLIYESIAAGVGFVTEHGEIELITENGTKHTLISRPTAK